MPCATTVAFRSHAGSGRCSSVSTAAWSASRWAWSRACELLAARPNRRTPPPAPAGRQRPISIDAWPALGRASHWLHHVRPRRVTCGAKPGITDGTRTVTCSRAPPISTVRPCAWSPAARARPPAAAARTTAPRARPRARRRRPTTSAQATSSTCQAPSAADRQHRQQQPPSRWSPVPDVCACDRSYEGCG